MMAFGENIGDTSIAYYINLSRHERMIEYTYPSAYGQFENAHFVDKPDHHGHYINIMNIEHADFKEVDSVKRKDIIMILASTVEDIVAASVKKGVKNESLPALYGFDYKGREILCGFDMVDEISDLKSALYYCIVKDKPHGNFARYKYSDDKVDFTEHIGEHSYMYAKIINLAEPFPFFKMPE